MNKALHMNLGVRGYSFYLERLKFSTHFNSDEVGKQAMIYHVFNSSLVSGPETLVFPALARFGERARVLLLQESRIAREKQEHVEAYLDHLGLPYDRIAVESRWDANAVQALARLLQGSQERMRSPSSGLLQLAHAHDVKSSFYLWRAFKQIQEPKFKIVSTHHGVHARSGLINHLYEEIYARIILPQYDRSLVVCSSDKKLLCRRGVPAERVRVHLNGVSRQKVAPSERQTEQNKIRERWGIEVPSDTFVFGVVARLAAEKRHALLLEVLSWVRKLAPEFAFVVLCFGRGELETRLKQVTEQKGLANHVRWMGYQPGIGNEFAGFDALLSMSSAEGLPINLIEAGWAATPVFASGVDGVLDLISEPGMGEVFAPRSSPREIAQKLLGFAASKQRLMAEGARFQEHVETGFSEDKWVDELLKIYSELGVESLV